MSKYARQYNTYCNFMLQWEYIQKLIYKAETTNDPQMFCF